MRFSFSSHCLRSDRESFLSTRKSTFPTGENFQFSRAQGTFIIFNLKLICQVLNEFFHSKHRFKHSWIIDHEKLIKIALGKRIKNSAHKLDSLSAQKEGTHREELPNLWNHQSCEEEKVKVFVIRETKLSTSSLTIM